MQAYSDVDRPLQPPSKVHLIPVEILSEIFLLAVEPGDEDQTNVMLVCWHWCATMLSIPGMHFVVRIRNSTREEDVQAAMRGRRWLLGLSIDIATERPEFNADDFHGSFLAAAQGASRWRALEFFSLPPPGVCKPLQILQPLERLESFTLNKRCNFGNFFEPLMTAITTTPTHLTKMDLGNLDAILYLVQPACVHIFHSLKVLKIWLPKRMEGPVDILPHLQRLEVFAAENLFLPIYPSDVHLPLIQTLHELALKCVSVQWMAGHAFPALMSCDITFPHHANTIALQPVSMPSCTRFEYDSNDLGPLKYFNCTLLEEMFVKSGQWSVWMGNYQLISLSSMLTASAQRLTRLGVHVQCSESLLTGMLRLVPALKELELGFTSPHALSEKFFQQLVAAEPSASSSYEMIRLSSLESLNLSCKRWLRGSERKTPIPFFAIAHESSFNLWLTCPELCLWRVHGAVEIFHVTQSWYRVLVGVPSPHGIVRLSSTTNIFGTSHLPFKEAEYLYMNDGQLSVDLLFTFHHLVELRTHERCQFRWPTALPVNLPFYHVIRVLEAKEIHPSYLAGQTFHKLERCRLGLDNQSFHLNESLFTEMPVCTRLDIRDLSWLATFKLPLISELGVSFNNPASNLIWEKDIAVNANLSKLRLLHVHGWHRKVDLIQILRFVPILDTLLVGNGAMLDVDFFRALVPNQTSGTRESNSVTQIPTVLCPMLQTLQIEELDPTERSELMDVLREAGTLRAVVGSPLKRFTFFDFYPKPGSKFELIGKDGSVTMEKTLLDKEAKPFKLDI
jgi:hypothetical protein